jgi:hypothetical protein
MQYILSEIELQELQDKAISYDAIYNYVERGISKRKEYHSCAIAVYDDIDKLL